MTLLGVALVSFGASVILVALTALAVTGAVAVVHRYGPWGRGRYSRAQPSRARPAAP